MGEVCREVWDRMRPSTVVFKYRMRRLAFRGLEIANQQAHSAYPHKSSSTHRPSVRHLAREPCLPYLRNIPVGVQAETWRGMGLEGDWWCRKMGDGGGVHNLKA